MMDWRLITMCKELEDNRRMLAEIIYGRITFTAKEVVEEYRKKKGSTLVDGVLGVTGYITHLRDLGVLQLKSGRYIVQIEALMTA